MCRISCTVEKDLIVPKEDVTIHATFDNSNCQLPIEKYLIRVLRRIQVFKDDGKELLFVKDDYTYQEEFEA